MYNITKMIEIKKKNGGEGERTEERSLKGQPDRIVMLLFQCIVPVESDDDNDDDDIRYINIKNPSKKKKRKEKKFNTFCKSHLLHDLLHQHHRIAIIHH